MNIFYFSYVFSISLLYMWHNFYFVIKIVISWSIYLRTNLPEFVIRCLKFDVDIVIALPENYSSWYYRNPQELTLNLIRRRTPISVLCMHALELNIQESKYKKKKKRKMLCWLALIPKWPYEHVLWTPPPPPFLMFSSRRRWLIFILKIVPTDQLIYREILCWWKRDISDLFMLVKINRTLFMLVKIKDIVLVKIVPTNQ